MGLCSILFRNIHTSNLFLPVRTRLPQCPGTTRRTTRTRNPGPDRNEPTLGLAVSIWISSSLNGPCAFGGLFGVVGVSKFFSDGSRCARLHKDDSSERAGQGHVWCASQYPLHWGETMATRCSVGLGREKAQGNKEAAAVPSWHQSNLDPK